MLFNKISYLINFASLSISSTFQITCSAQSLVNEITLEQYHSSTPSGISQILNWLNLNFFLIENLILSCGKHKIPHTKNKFRPDRLKLFYLWFKSKNPVAINAN